MAWQLAFQHLLLSMVGFGLRVYSQHPLVAQQQKLWASYHERIAAAILEAGPSSIGIDDRGRLVVVDGTPESLPRDHDGDGFAETIVVSASDAGQVVAGDAQAFYDKVRAKVGNWGLLPLDARTIESSASGTSEPRTASGEVRQVPEVLQPTVPADDTGFELGPRPGTANPATRAGQAMTCSRAPSRVWAYGSRLAAPSTGSSRGTLR